MSKLHNLLSINTPSYHSKLEITQLKANAPAYCSKVEIAVFYKNSKSLLKIEEETAC
jgi:hypothetical protein